MHWGQVVFYNLADKLEHLARRYLELLPPNSTTRRAILTTSRLSGDDP